MDERSGTCFGNKSAALRVRASRSASTIRFSMSFRPSQFCSASGIFHPSRSPSHKIGCHAQFHDVMTIEVRGPETA